MRQLEEKRIADWLREFGAAGFIQDLDGDGSQTPAEIFDAADKRLNSLVSLGVMAGLLAGTAITTLLGSRSQEACKEGATQVLP